MKRRIVLFVVSLVLSLFLVSVPGRVELAQAQGPQTSGPFFRQAAAVAAFDGDLRKLPKTPPGQPRVLPLRGRVSAGAVSNNSNSLRSIPSLAAPLAKSNMPTPVQNFNGIGWTNVGWPPDTNGDVGLNHYVQTVNTSFAVYSKTGTLLAGPTTFDALFAPLGTTTPCGNKNEGDPVALYDQLADRWLVSDFAFGISATGNPIAPFYECIAVSKTSDPVSGGWYLYALLADSSLLNDYPKFGLWSDAYYMTANMYNLTTNDVHVRVWALDRNAMLNGTLNTVFFDLPTCTAASSVCRVFSFLPSNLRGTPPPAGTPDYLANIETANTTTALPFGSNVIHVWKFSLNGAWPNPPATFKGPLNVTVAAFYEPLVSSSQGIAMNYIPQPGTTTKLDTLGDRLMMQLQYRNVGGVQSLWATHTVYVRASATSIVTGVRWYQIDVSSGTPTLTQQGIIAANDGVYRWMPSLAVDQKGDMVVGYSASGTSVFPSLRYAGRLATDPLNRTAQGEAVLFNGSGSQTSYPTLGAITRWGDYSAMSIDPSDGCTFWYTNEYYATTGYQWSTRIGSTKFPGCP